LSKLIAAVERGERVVITKHGKPAAELVAPKQEKRPLRGFLADKVGPPPDEFFDPMTEKELREWEGR
ncbi:MAG: type II toxin-antitoxin system prevent-host-death family antitoxin, partial [Pseudomonadota bacterium]